MASSDTVAMLVIGAMVLSTVFVGATAGDVFTDDPNPDELVKAVVTEPPEFDTLRGVRTREITINKVDPERSKTSVVKEAVWLDVPNRTRIDVIGADSGTNTAEGDVLLIDNSTLKRYKADHEVMTVDRNWEPGDQPLDSDILLEDYQTEYLGTETVADRETHVVEIQPARNASVKAALTFHLGSRNFGVMTVRAEADKKATFDYTTTWWIDTETMYPVKERVEWEPEDPQDHPDKVASKVRTYQYETISFNGSIPDGQFRFTPPNGTEVHAAAKPLDIDTVEDADRVAPFAVPDPPLPERFELVQTSGLVLKDNVTVSFLYSDGDNLAESDTVRIEWFQSAAKYDDERIVEENVGRINGTVIEYASGPILFYECDDVRIEISAGIQDGDDEGFAIELAERVGCE